MVNGVLLSQNLKDMKNKGQDGIFSYTKPFSVPEGTRDLDLDFFRISQFQA